MWNISYEKPTHGLFKDRTGEAFGRLRIVSFNHIKRNESQSITYWKCICECGNEVTVDISNLVSGLTVSCGCYKKERVSKANTTHGLCNHPLYDRAYNEIQRCHNPNDPHYHHYGGRGITVYEPWRNDVGLMIKDIERLIGLPPTKKHQIDRPNNDGNYEPNNICWKTPRENSQNKRNNHLQAADPVTGKTTPTYIAWRNLLANYGNEVCIEWRYDGNPDTDNGFKQFFADMGDKPKDRHNAPLVRIDETKPFQKGNVVWGYGRGKRKRIKP